jgi:hypothetical protein
VEVKECALIRKKAVPAFAWRTDENYKEASLRSHRSLVRDLKARLPEDETAVLLAPMLHSVTLTTEQCNYQMFSCVKSGQSLHYF